MSWFVIAKDDMDIGSWADTQECNLLLIAANGEISVLNSWQVRLPDDLFLAVLNIAPFPKETTTIATNERRRILEVLKSGLPKTIEGVFVHFGGYNPEAENATVEGMMEKWLNQDKYPGLPDLFTGLPILPYSATLGQTWCLMIRNLASEIRRCGNLCSSIVQENISDWGNLLMTAKELAMKKYGQQGEAIQRAIEYNLACALMPAFIYLDGLVYAHDIKDQKMIGGMERLIQSDLEQVLNAVTPESLSPCPQTIQNLINRFKSEPENLDKISSDFCGEYRNFLQRFTPKAAASGDASIEQDR